MKKVLGYVSSVVGLLILAVSLDVFKLPFEILEGISSIYVIGIGGILVAVGIVLILLDGGSEKIKQAEEVPIYEGKGKKRKIVAYQRH